MRIERVTTNGFYGTWPLENNCYLAGDDKSVLIIDAPHQAELIEKAVAGRKVAGIAITHGHADHTNAALELAKMVGHPPIYLNFADNFLWQQTHKKQLPDQDLAKTKTLSVGNITLEVLATPGHTPGSTCFYWADEKKLFSGDTLFPGGPGATRWQYSNFGLIMKSIKEQLFVLPDEVEILPGHGESSTLVTEKPGFEHWLARGW
jgi:glyoxylase-like metal-dependent hydrolase (beta-lactamase superfamily II)